MSPRPTVEELRSKTLRVLRGHLNVLDAKDYHAILVACQAAAEQGEQTIHWAGALSLALERLLQLEGYKVVRQSFVGADGKREMRFISWF